VILHLLFSSALSGKIFFYFRTKVKNRFRELPLPFDIMAKRSRREATTRNDSEMIEKGHVMEDEREKGEGSRKFAFECDGCGESFESWQRLRQHAVDCKTDESEDWL